MKTQNSKKIKDILVSLGMLALCLWFVNSGPPNSETQVDGELLVEFQKYVESHYPEAGEKKQVLVFETSWCGTCRYLKSQLQGSSIPYLAFDVEKDLTAQRFFAQLQGGGKAVVPLVVVGSVVIIGADVARIKELLADIS